MPHFQQAQATDYRDLLNVLRDFASSDHVDTAVVNAGGSGYSVGDILTIDGGSSVFHVAATVEVLTVSAGAVLTVGIRQSGGYTTNPSPLTAVTTSTGGGGTGCTLDLTMSGVLWTVNRDETGNHQAGERELLLQGVGSGADQIFIGIRSYNDSGSGATNFEVAGFSGFNSVLTWDLQPGKSPGRFDSAQGGAFIPLRDGTMNYWLNIDGRRIIVVAEVGTGYASCYLGFMNVFATAAEYPYPLYIAGSTSQFDQVFSDTEISYSGIADPIRHDDGGGPRGGDVGPGFFRAADGVWTTVYNSEIAGSNRNIARQAIISPAGDFVNPVNTSDQWFSTALGGFNDFVPSSGSPGAPTRAWRPTPNTGGDVYPTWPCTIFLQDSAVGRQMIGEMDDVRWLPALIGPVVAMDTLLGDTHTVFQCGNRSEPWALFLMRTRP